VTLQWIFPLSAILIYGGLLAFIARRRGWGEPPIQRLVFYLLLAMLADGALLAAQSSQAISGDGSVILRTYLYAQAALPVFFYAFARAYIRVEQKPWAFLAGLILWIAIILIDVLQLTLNPYSIVVPTATVVFLLRTVVWAFFTAFVVTLGAIEQSRTPSPLHRNRLSYLMVALPFFVSHDALELLLGEPVRPYIPLLQMMGVAIYAYAALQHDLLDLRDLMRRSARAVIVTIFAMIVYVFVITLAVAELRDADPRGILGGVIVIAIALALFFQLVRDFVARSIELLLFGQRYDVRAVVQSFSQRLTEQIELDELVSRAKALFREAPGARDAALFIVSKEDHDYMLRVVPTPSDGMLVIRLAESSSVMNVLAERAQPLLQYDVDRLPQYADLPPEARLALQSLRAEVFVPIHSQGALIGVWVIGAKVSGDRYSQSDIALLVTLADQSAIALENARLLSDLREQMMRTSAMRDYLDSTLASIATGVVTLDQDGRITSFNRAAQDIFRITASNALGRHYDQVLPPMEGAQLPMLLTRIWARTHQQIVRDTLARVPGRDQVHLTIHLSGIWQAQEMVGVAMVIEDLTEQARLELERRKQEQETQRVRDTFERYVAPTVVQGLLADPKRVALGGDRQLVTILFADLHGFTKLSEELAPEELVKVLNDYLSLAYQAILRYEGTVDKFLGDGLMAIFNAPLLQPDHAWRAARAALALQREIVQYAPPGSERARLTFRVGLHTGEAVVGNIGTRELMNYTAVGDTVNVAKRLQENAEGNQILLSRSTHELIQNKIVVRAREKLLVRGRETPVEVFELVGAWEEN
jgi:PAS domain S-box-containing protein